MTNLNSFEPVPIGERKPWQGISVVTLLSDVLSQHCLYGDQKLAFQSESGEFYDLIEKSTDTEDFSVLFTAEQIRTGISLASLIMELEHIEQESLGDSRVLFLAGKGESWALSFSSDDENVIVMDHTEVGVPR